MMGAVEGVRALGATPGRGRKMAGFGKKLEKCGKNWGKHGDLGGDLGLGRKSVEV